MEREILWSPSEERSKNSALAKYMAWLRKHYSLEFATYPELWNGAPMIWNYFGKQFGYILIFDQVNPIRKF